MTKHAFSGPHAKEPTPPGRQPLLGKLAIVGATGLIFTGALFGFTNLASADTGGETPAPPAEADADGQDSDEVSEFDSFSEQDRDLILEFEQCLTDAGIPIEEGTDEPTDEQLDDIDAIFEQCETVLDGLSFDADEWLEPEHGDFEDHELSPEDEAVFEEFEQCLTDAGLDLEADEETLTDEDFDKLDAAIENCESILDGLSEDVAADFDEDFELSAEDEAVFERFDDCIEGVLGHYDEEADLTDEQLENVDELFEGCEVLLEELSEDAAFIFEDCPDEEGDHEEGDREESDVENTVSA